MKSILLFAATLSYSLCVHAQPITLSGSHPELNPENKIFISNSDGIIDSAVITNDHFKFVLTGVAPNCYFLRMRISNEDFTFPVFVESENIHIDFAKTKSSIKFTGGKIAGHQELYWQKVFQMNELRLRDLRTHQGGSTKDSLHYVDSVNRHFDSQLQKISLESVRSNPESKFSVAIICFFLEGASAETVAEAQSVLHPIALTDNPLAERLIILNAEARLNKHFGRDKILRDFVMNDINGIPQKYSEIAKGKTVLLDIWASWCGPCRANSNDLKKLAARYNKNNFIVVGISADDNKARWKQAVEEDKLTWVQLSDLKGTDQGFLHERGVWGYPTYVLVLPDGKIRSSHARIEGVSESLYALFGY